ncbi:hypothetical protein JCM10449v2_007646 [Rhodotorula kratochvilovae]
MQPTFPLELQLQVLELAIPPLTRKNLPHLRELMKTWPLVSRAWKAWAYAKVPVIPKLVLSDAETDQATLDRFRAVVRFEVDVEVWEAAEVTADMLREVAKDAKALWVTLPQGDYEWLLELPALHHLDIDDEYRDAARDIFDKSHALLQYLVLRRMIIYNVAATFASVTTLVMSTCLVYDDVLTLFKRFPSLRILALHEGNAFGNIDKVLTRTSSYPPTLQHLLLSDCASQCSSLPPSVPLRFPATLKTLTLRYSISAPPQCRTTAELVRTACAGTNTKFIEVVYDRDDPLEAAFDIEEWALSVRA